MRRVLTVLVLLRACSIAVCQLSERDVVRSAKGDTPWRGF